MDKIRKGHVKLDSALFRSAGWVEDGHWDGMEVEFSNGSVYRYPVPRALFDGLVSAKSAGSFYHTNIRGKFTGTQVGK